MYSGDSWNILKVFVIHQVFLFVFTSIMYIFFIFEELFSKTR